MMKCECGWPVNEEDKHCPNCGLLLFVYPQKPEPINRSYRLIAVLLLAAFILFDYFFLDPIYKAVNPHIYIHGIDVPITTHESTNDNGDKVTIIDSWYNSEHELHQYTTDRNHIQWRDFNKHWHTETIYPNINLYIIGIQLALVIFAYYYLRYKATPKPEIKKITF